MEHRTMLEEETLLNLIGQGETGLLSVDSAELDFDAQSMETVDVLLSSLNEEEFAVVDKFFGLSGEEPLSAEEIGDLFGIDDEAVMAMVGNALRQMRSAEVNNERKVA